MMKKNDEILRFERDINEQPELKKKLEAEIKRIAEAGEAECDAEAMVKAAASQGYTITMEELQRSTADLEKLDIEELDAVGGFGKKPTPRSEWIPTEKGHDVVCLGVWHCYTAFLHTETSDKRVPCWKDHSCMFVNKDTESVCWKDHT